MLAGVTGVFLLLSLTPVGAASSNVSRSYTAAENIPNGSLVSVDAKHSDQIRLANVDNGTRLLGVSLQSKDSLLAVDVTPGKVQVATSGTAQVLVSTLGGPLKVNDEVGVSPFSGIGMKAAPGSRIIGLTQTPFSKDSEGAVEKTVTDKNGKKSTLTIGYARVTISIATDGSLSKEARLNGLQRFVQGLTGRTIPTIRILMSIIIAITALLVLVSVIYSAIYGSIISIGRNPLARYAVFRTLGGIIVIALLIAGVAAASVYFLLR